MVIIRCTCRFRNMLKQAPLSFKERDVSVLNKHSARILVIKSSLLMLYKIKVTICSESHVRHIKVITRQNFLMLNLLVLKVTSRLTKVNVGNHVV
jgi:hypothetical protein